MLADSVNETRAADARIVVTGMAARTAVAGNLNDLALALRAGRSGIRSRRDDHTGAVRLGAWLPDEAARFDNEGEYATRARSILRGAPRTTVLACAVALEAHARARGDTDLDGSATALVVAGSNLQQRYLAEHYQRFAERRAYLPPRFAVHFLDTHLVGAISELLGLRGPGFTTGGAAASGNVALYQACQLLRAGEATACACVGPLCDFSDFELQAFANLGAMHPEGPDEPPDSPCRPFDRGHRGFVHGEASGCVIIETLAQAQRRGAPILAELAGVSLVLDGNHGANPSVDGEVRSMQLALQRAGLEPAAVDYLNAHGTASAMGDEAECQAIRQVFGVNGRPAINATKALLGHTFSAAGIMEVIATILQMQHGFLHPNPYLDQPIDDALRFVGKQSEAADVQCAVSNSFGFGGINSSVVLRRLRS